MNKINNSHISKIPTIIHNKSNDKINNNRIYESSPYVEGINRNKVDTHILSWRIGKQRIIFHAIYEYFFKLPTNRRRFQQKRFTKWEKHSRVARPVLKNFRKIEAVAPIPGMGDKKEQHPCEEAEYVLLKRDKETARQVSTRKIWNK